MSGGPIFPNSTYPVTTGNAFPNFYVGAGANSQQDEGLGVAASIGSDTTWALRFQLPPAIPTGTCKLMLRALANATTGVANVNPKWGIVAGNQSPSDMPLAAEGTNAVTWSNTIISVKSIVVGAGGTGYSTNDIITQSTGTFTTAAKYIVTAQTVGVATALRIINEGVYTVLPGAAAATTGGTGSGLTVTVTGNTAGSADTYIDTKITLDANPAPTTGDENAAIVMNLVFETSGYTLAQVSTWIVSLIWE